MRYEPKLVVVCDSDLITSRIVLHLVKKVTVAMVNVSTYIVAGNGNATVVSAT